MWEGEQRDISPRLGLGLGLGLQAFDTFREFRHSLATFRYVAWALAPLRYTGEESQFRHLLLLGTWASGHVLYRSAEEPQFRPLQL